MTHPVTTKTTKTTDELVEASIARIAPYEPGKPIEELERELGRAWGADGCIKLASNENPYGPSPRALEAAMAALIHGHRYPDGGAFSLRQRLAAHLGVGPERLLLGGGSNEIIDLLVRTFCAAGEEVVAPAYSFVAYRLAAECHRVPFRAAPVGPRFAIDVEALLGTVSERTKLVFLANPNNPTGAYLDRAAFAELLARLPSQIILAVDEAYFEYVRAPDCPNALDFCAARERLVVLRTFSKIYGLAGLRVGYAVAPAAMVGYFERVRLPFNVSLVAQAAARAALDDHGHVEHARRANGEELVRVSDRLAGLGLDVLPAQTNFVLVDCGAEAAPLYRALLERGVIVRPLGAYGLPHHLRITVGTAGENARLGDAMAEALQALGRLGHDGAAARGGV